MYVNPLPGPDSRRAGSVHWGSGGSDATAGAQVPRGARAPTGFPGNNDESIKRYLCCRWRRRCSSCWCCVIARLDRGLRACATDIFTPQFSQPRPPAIHNSLRTIWLLTMVGASVVALQSRFYTLFSVHIAPYCNIRQLLYGERNTRIGYLGQIILWKFCRNYTTEFQRHTRLY